MTIKSNIVTTHDDDKKNLVVIPRSELEAIGKMIYSLRVQCETLETVARAAGIDTWISRDMVTTLADEIVRVEK